MKLILTIKYYIMAFHKRPKYLWWAKEEIVQRWTVCGQPYKTWCPAASKNIRHGVYILSQHKQA